ncbi:ribonuclease H2 subunit B isoform X1 [Xiphophorus hellerii]|uniref:ribonuclease H2 subunit B isoform X1 n=1 Tax=Xiphophorus hellerii TaxID=8084 RepID=UPI0013B3FB52|nr:ribonuclease H2 subunit B isoform X1 [Xiphophorus hellerii]
MAAKKKRTPNTHNDSWVVIAADSAVETQKHDCDPDFVKLRNPSTDEASLYMLSAGDVQLYEVKAFEEDFHSWFVGQTVQRDGKLLFVTQMDPLYLILPYMIKSGQEGKFQPVDQVVKDDEFPASSRLLSCIRSLTSLHHIAEGKEVGSLKFHRYSQERTLNWLQKKVERTIVALKKKHICVGEGVKSTTYVRVKTESDNQEEDYLRYAHGLISEYISEELSKALLKHLGLPELKSAKETEPPSKWSWLRWCLCFCASCHEKHLSRPRLAEAETFRQAGGGWRRLHQIQQWRLCTETTQEDDSCSENFG